MEEKGGGDNKKILFREKFFCPKIPLVYIYNNIQRELFYGRACYQISFIFRVKV